MLQQMQQEVLREILRLGFVIAPSPDELLERGPITPEEVLECFPPRRFTAQGGLGQQTPMCRGEIHVPGSLGQRHAPRTGRLGLRFHCKNEPTANITNSRAIPSGKKGRAKAGTRTSVRSNSR